MLTENNGKYTLTLDVTNFINELMESILIYCEVNNLETPTHQQMFEFFKQKPNGLYSAIGHGEIVEEVNTVLWDDYDDYLGRNQWKSY